MEELKTLTNQELLQLYHLLMEHLAYLETEKNKVEEPAKW